MRKRNKEAVGSRHAFYMTFEAMKILRAMADREGQSMSAILCRLVTKAGRKLSA